MSCELAIPFYLTVHTQTPTKDIYTEAHIITTIDEIPSLINTATIDATFSRPEYEPPVNPDNIVKYSENFVVMCYGDLPVAICYTRFDHPDCESIVNHYITARGYQTVIHNGYTCVVSSLVLPLFLN